MIRLHQTSLTGPARDVTRQYFPAPTGEQLTLGHLLDQAKVRDVDKNQTSLFQEVADADPH